MGGTGLEPVTSCVSSRKVTPKYLFYNDLYSNYTPLHKKYTQSTHRDHWMDYNHYRPHSSLDYTAPAAFGAKCLEQGSGTLRLPQDKENECGILS